MKSQKHYSKRQHSRGPRRSSSNNSGGNPLSRVYDSNGPDVKVRGTAQTVAEKYLQLGRDAQLSSDNVMAENYYQHAEHYLRIVAAAQAYYQQNQQQYRRPDDMSDEDGNEDMEDYQGDRPQGSERPSMGAEGDGQPAVDGEGSSIDGDRSSQPQQMRRDRNDYERSERPERQDRGERQARGDQQEPRSDRQEPRSDRQEPRSDRQEPRNDRQEPRGERNDRYDRGERQDRGNQRPRWDRNRDRSEQPRDYADPARQPQPRIEETPVESAGETNGSAAPNGGWEAPSFLRRPAAVTPETTAPPEKRARYERKPRRESVEANAEGQSDPAPAPTEDVPPAA